MMRETLTVGSSLGGQWGRARSVKGGRTFVGIAANSRKMTQANISGTVEVEMVPGGMDITFGDNQIALTYDGETTTVELDDDGFFVNNSENVAPSHGEAQLDILKGAYEVHRNHVDEQH